MKKSNLLIIALVVLVIAGLAFHFKGNMFSSPIEPYDKWPTILVGEWDFKALERSEHETILVKGIINFKPNKEFILHESAKFWSTDHVFHYGEEDAANIITGGVVSGNWQFIDNSAFKLNAINCSFTNTHLEPNYISPYIECAYIDQKKFGNMEDTIRKTKIESFNRDSILITGTNFSKDGTIRYLFTKKQE